jgi:hypothetical protein
VYKAANASLKVGSLVARPTRLIEMPCYDVESRIPEARLERARARRRGGERKIEVKSFERPRRARRPLRKHLTYLPSQDRT